MTDFIFNPVAYLGTENRASNTEIILGLESMKNEIANKGMSRDMYHRVESILPGTLSNAGIDVRRLTTNNSSNGQRVAVEAIDVAGALKGATGVLGVAGTAVAGAGLLAGIGYLMYRFYKWATGKSGKSSKEGSDKGADRTAEAASENYASSRKATPPEDPEIKKIYDDYLAKGDAITSSAILWLLHKCEQEKFQPNVASQLADRVASYVKAGSGGNVIAGYLIDHKDGIHPHWMLDNIVKAQELSVLTEYTKHVTQLSVIVCKKIENKADMEAKVKELAKVFVAMGINVDLNRQGDEQPAGFIKRVLDAIAKALGRAKASPTLEQIINQAGEAHVSKAAQMTIDAYKSEKYSIYQGVSGTGLSNEIKPLTDEHFRRMLALYNGGENFRVTLQAEVTAMGQLWGAASSELGKSALTEDDVKQMSNIPGFDKTDTVHMQYSALSQAAYKHVGYALRAKNTLDYVSSEIASCAKTFIDIGSK